MLAARATWSSCRRPRPSVLSRSAGRGRYGREDDADSASSPGTSRSQLDPLARRSPQLDEPRFLAHRPLRIPDASRRASPSSAQPFSRIVEPSEQCAPRQAAIRPRAAPTTHRPATLQYGDKQWTRGKGFDVCSAPATGWRPSRSSATERRSAHRAAPERRALPGREHVRPAVRGATPALVAHCVACSPSSPGDLILSGPRAVRAVITASPLARPSRSQMRSAVVRDAHPSSSGIERRVSHVGRAELDASLGRLAPLPAPLRSSSVRRRAPLGDARVAVQSLGRPLPPSSEHRPRRSRSSSLPALPLLPHRHLLHETRSDAPERCARCRSHRRAVRPLRASRARRLLHRTSWPRDRRAARKSRRARLSSSARAARSSSTRAGRAPAPTARGAPPSCPRASCGRCRAGSARTASPSARRRGDLGRVVQRADGRRCDVPPTSRMASSASSISSGWKGIGSICQIRSQLDVDVLLVREPLASPPSRRARIRASLPASRWRWSSICSAVSTTEVTIPGLQTTPPDVHTAPPPARAGDLADLERELAAPASASRRWSIGVEPACAAWPRHVIR